MLLQLGKLGSQNLIFLLETQNLISQSIDLFVIRCISFAQTYLQFKFSFFFDQLIQSLLVLINFFFIFLLSLLYQNFLFFQLGVHLLFVKLQFFYFKGQLIQKSFQDGLKVTVFFYHSINDLLLQRKVFQELNDIFRERLILILL